MQGSKLKNTGVLSDYLNQNAAPKAWEDFSRVRLFRGGQASKAVKPSRILVSRIGSRTLPRRTAKTDLRMHLDLFSADF